MFTLDDKKIEEMRKLLKNYPLFKLELELVDQKELLMSKEKQDHEDGGATFLFTEEDYKLLLQNQDKLEQTYKEAEQELTEKKKTITVLREILDSTTNIDKDSTLEETMS